MIRSSLSLLALPCAFTTPAFAENWRLAAGNDTAREYVDVESIVRNGNRVRFTRETRFPSLQSIESVPNFDRLLTLHAGDCGARSLQRLQITAKRGTEVVGTFEGDRAIEAAEPGSIAAGILSAVCDNDWPDETQ
jgi:hypothetical protein